MRYTFTLLFLLLRRLSLETRRGRTLCRYVRNATNHPAAFQKRKRGYVCRLRVHKSAVFLFLSVFFFINFNIFSTTKKKKKNTKIPSGYSFSLLGKFLKIMADWIDAPDDVYLSGVSTS